MPGHVDLQHERIRLRRIVRMRNEPAKTSTRPIVTTCLAEIQPQPVVWLWGQFLARGMVTLLTGTSGVGKSFVALDAAAAVTRGERRFLRNQADRDDEQTATDDEAEQADPGDALLISPESQLVEIVRPRLEAAGADMSRIHALRGVRKIRTIHDEGRCWLFQLDEDLGMLEQEIKHRNSDGAPLRLIVIDPFPLELMDERTGAADFIATIQQLAEIAAQSGTAVLLVANCPAKPRANQSHHLRTLEMAVPSTWKIVSDLPDRRLLLPEKSSLTETVPGRSFKLRDGQVQWDPDPVWSTVPQYETQVLERSRTSLFEQEWSELARATHWLRNHLRQGPVPLPEIKKVSFAQGFAYTTLRRAFCGLKCVSTRIPGSHAWIWRLNDDDVPEPSFPPGIECGDEEEAGRR